MDRRLLRWYPTLLISRTLSSLSFSVGQGHLQQVSGTPERGGVRELLIIVVT